ncbi:hypothetical protein, partial [Bradyrhizobium liaoningense]|uniref:hypothetical protein n=1 Tax=Bradyrhizobium liaoningense TaxID=43992 RepID=UPI001BA554BD
ESYAASALYTTLASLSGALSRIRRARGATCSFRANRPPPDLYQANKVNRKKNDMKEQHRMDVRQRPKTNEKDVAPDCQQTETGHRGHAKRCQHRD